jgi:hypothetical protein
LLALLEFSDDGPDKKVHSGHLLAPIVSPYPWPAQTGKLTTRRR